MYLQIPPNDNFFQQFADISVLRLTSLTVEEPGRQEDPDVGLGGWTLFHQKVSLWGGMFLVPA